MTRHSVFDPKDIAAFPAVIPVFPLTGALLLPRAELPLNIFEPRYLALVNDCLEAGRMFGMVQPATSRSCEAKPVLYKIGTLGRISAFQETADGRFYISLRGLCRFDIAEELEVATPYRQIRPSYADYTADLVPGDEEGVKRDALLPMLRNYFDRHRMEVDWGCIEKAPTERLVNYLAMICPFDPCEKQVLLEAPTIAERSRLLMSFLQISGRDRSDSSNSRVQ